MSGIRNLFRDLIKLEEQKEKLTETNPNAFEEISLVSYPESWEAQEEEEGPKTLGDMEPFCLNWTDFDRKFEGKWDLIVQENTEPLPEEDQETEGLRDLYGPVENLDDYPDIPALYCRRAQPTRLPRNFKQRLPFPVLPIPEEPTLHVKPWMVEPFPPAIDWNKQFYKGLGGTGVNPLYIRWNEYPEYDVDEVNKYEMIPLSKCLVFAVLQAHPVPSIKEMAMSYAKNTKKTRGLCRIKQDKEPMTPEELADFFEEKEKDKAFRNLLLGDLPDHWWQDRKDQEVRDFADHEVVGRKQTTEQEGRKTIEQFLAGNPFKEIDLPRNNVEIEGKARSWTGGKRWGGKTNEWRDEKYEKERALFESRERPFRGGKVTIGGNNSWAGKGSAASGWFKGKLPRAQEPQEEFFDPPHPEDPDE